MIEALHLPVLDLQDSSLDLGHKLVQIVAKYGFVYVKSHGTGITADRVTNMFDLAHDFFKSSTDSKQDYAVNSAISGKNSGWFGMNVEKLDPAKQKTGDFKEAFNMNEFLDGKAQQPLPSILEEHEAEINNFVNSCHTLCQRILELFAVGLSIEESSGGKSWFSQCHNRSEGPSGSVFRLLYYPKLESEVKIDTAKDIRAGAHSDYGSITLLFQKAGQPGLEILEDRETDVWKAVDINPTNEAEVPILVNVGDLLSYWTNGLLRSTVHRVVFPSDGESSDRYSIAYFCHPLDNAKLVPIPSKMVQQCIQERGPSEIANNAITAKEHLENRLKATYS